MTTYRIFHMKRGGGHATALWFASHLESVRYLNDVDASGEDLPDPLATGLIKEATRHCRSAGAAATIVTHEDRLPRDVKHLIGSEDRSVCVIRNPIAVVASRLAAARRWPDFEIDDGVDTWTRFADHLMDPRETSTPIVFDELERDPKYRRRKLHQITGLDVTDRGLHAKFSSSEPEPTDFARAFDLIASNRRVASLWDSVQAHYGRLE